MNPADRDALFDRQLQDYIGWRTSYAPGAPDLATMTTRVSAAVDMRARQRSTTLRALAIAAALAALAMLAIGGALVGGTLRLDPLRAEVPPAVPSATAVPTSSAVIATEPFTSRLNGYTIKYPSGWEKMYASQSWLSDGPPTSDQVDAFLRPFSPNYERFTVASRAMYADWTEQRWIETFVPLPAEVTTGGCTFGDAAPGPFLSIVRESKVPEWEPTFIAGRSATMRSICGHVDVVAFVDGRAYLLSLFSRSGIEGDTSLFRGFADTFELPKPAPRPAPTPEATPSPALPVASEAFRSPVYGYSIQPPEGWEMAPAIAAWDGTEPWGASEADIATPASLMAGRRLTIVSTRLPAGMTRDAWIDAHTQGMPLEFKIEGSHRHCVFGGSGPVTMITEGASVSITDGVIDGRPAHIRTICGHITAIVIVDDRVYQLSLFMGFRPNGDRALFDAVMATVDFDPPLEGPEDGSTVSARFTSPRHGYTMDVPSGWQVLPATRAWTTDARPAVAGVSDVFVDWHHRPIARLTVAARSRPAGMSDDRFVADAAPLPATVRTDGSTVRCVFDDRVVERGPIPPWQADIIGGHPAQVRSMCGTVDAVVFVGERGYLLTLVSGTGTTGELGRFRELVATLRFDDGLQTFVSDAFGYALRYPPDWSVAAASVGWAGGAPPRQATDRLVAPKSTAELTVTARELADGMTEDQWINANVPAIVGGARCPSGGLTAPVLGLDWLGTTIDGRSARVRDACAQVDGVVFADGVGYWLRLTSSEPRKGGNVAPFDRLMASIDLDAVAPTLVASGSQAGRTASETFSSRRYGYTIRYPADWTVEAATKRWSGAGSWKANMADQLSGPESAPLRFTVAARAAPEGVDPAWLGLYVPKPAAAQGRTCVKNGSHFIGVSALSAWTETTVAGRPARMRQGCGDVQAVVAVGETAFVLSLTTPSLASGGDAFRQIADTFRIAP